ncbi:MAG TPA: VOC family protein [Gaiellaceae bacterium]|nr:VOC family protein [Gaiellaceae bacterium]
MGLSDRPVGSTVAVSDMERAKEFYEGKLGLSGGKDQADGGRTYACGGGTRIHVYPSPDNAGKSGATLAAWQVDDIEGAVDELAGKGVSFEQYGEPLNTDAKGIARLGDLAAAWFKDPDGNILAVSTE